MRWEDGLVVVVLRRAGRTGARGGYIDARAGGWTAGAGPHATTARGWVWSSGRVGVERRGALGDWIGTLAAGSHNTLILEFVAVPVAEFPCGAFLRALGPLLHYLPGV